MSESLTIRAPGEPPAPTPATIHEQIQEWLTRFRVNGYFRDMPAFMYLGRLQSAALDAYAERFLTVHESTPWNCSNRRHYMGMQIHVVDADSHIDFGYRLTEPPRA